MDRAKVGEGKRERARRAGHQEGDRVMLDIHVLRKRLKITDKLLVTPPRLP